MRLAIVGLGGIDVPGSVGGRGRQLIDAFSRVPGAVGAFADVFERYQKHLAARGVAGRLAPGILGTWVTLDPVGERFVGALADRANAIATREYRAPFVVPTVA